MDTHITACISSFVNARPVKNTIIGTIYKIVIALCIETVDSDQRCFRGSDMCMLRFVDHLNLDC